jgi:hypothetical protein
MLRSSLLCGVRQDMAGGQASTPAFACTSISRARPSTHQCSVSTTGPTRPMASGALKPPSNTPAHRASPKVTKMKTRIERDYPFRAAGRVWTVPELRLTRLPDGQMSISQAEIDRVHPAIANMICASEAPLTGEEFEFLCDVADVSFAKVAEALDQSRSALTKWRSTGKPMPKVRSWYTKRWFWFRLFGESLGHAEVPLHLVEDEAAFLRWVGRQADTSDLIEAASVSEQPHFDDDRHLTGGVIAYPRMRLSQPWVVIDQNCMRAQSGLDFVSPLLEQVRQGAVSILVPDVAMVEMTQHPLVWESTLSRSLRALADHADGVVLGRAVSAMLREELETGEPTTEFIDRDLLHGFRELLVDLSRGHGEALNYFKERVDEARRSAGVDFYQHEANKSLVFDGYRGWLMNLSKTGKKHLKAGDTQLLRWLTQKAIQDHGVQALMLSGCTEADAVSLLSTPSISLAVVVSSFASQLLWVATGGLEGRRLKNVSNDRIDLDYVRLGVFGKGVLTRDGRMSALVEHVGAVMDCQVYEARMPVAETG